MTKKEDADWIFHTRKMCILPILKTSFINAKKVLDKSDKA